MRPTPSGRGSHLSTRQDRLCVSFTSEAFCVHSQPIVATLVEVVLPCHLRHHALLLKSCNIDNVQCNVYLRCPAVLPSCKKKKENLNIFPADSGLIRCLIPHGRAS